MSGPNPIQASSGITVLYPANDQNGNLVLSLVDKYIALLVELRVLTSLMSAGGPGELNQQRADELANIVPPGAL